MDDFQYSHHDAFERNIGLISQQELSELSGKLVVIPGCGGVGGVHAQTLARMGVGRFRISDPDCFSLTNFNRQIGANIGTIGRNKAEVIAEMLFAINPQADIMVVEGGINPENAAAFVDGADLLIDGIDFFASAIRRILFTEAWKRSIPGLTAAPLGFSGTLHVFMPDGQSFDEYFDLSDEQSSFDQFVNFLMGLAPRALQAPYLDLSTVKPAEGRGPSSIIGVQQAACLLGAEAVRILLGNKPSFLAPHFLQFDAYRQRLEKGYLYAGNRNWLQKIKRRWVVKRLQQMGLDQAFT